MWTQFRSGFSLIIWNDRSCRASNMTEHRQWFTLSAGCVHSGVRYEHGSRWRPADSPCDVCSCMVGLLWRLAFCYSSSVLAVFSGLHRRAVLAVRGSLAARHVQTQLLLCPIAAVQFAKVNLMSYYGVHRVIEPQILCVCGSGCGVNGHDYPNRARIPAGDPCQECTCVVRHKNKLCKVLSVFKDNLF